MNNFVINLLTGAENGASGGVEWINYVLIGVLVVAFVAMLFFSSRNNKKKQQEQEALMNSLRPGNKVKTIGGICGIVVEVNAEENTFVLETGNELNGKSYLKFDRQAIFQTDAKVEKTDAKVEKTDAKSNGAAEKELPVQTETDSVEAGEKEEK